MQSPARLSLAHGGRSAASAGLDVLALLVGQPKRGGDTMIDEKAALAGANMVLGALHGMTEVPWAYRVSARFGLPVTDELFQRAQQLLVDRGVIKAEPLGGSVLLQLTEAASNPSDGFRMLNGDDGV
jgi:hypothetical protein